jgi:hypothetical protein
MFDTDVVVNDTLIPPNLQDQIYLLLENPFFPWFLCEHKNITSSPQAYYYYKSINKNIFEYTQFTHEFISNEKINSNSVDYPMSIFETVATSFNFNSKVTRVKANLCPKVNIKNINAHQTPHVDSDQNHWVMIYYVNDSDGDTFLFDNDGLTIKHRITPKKGRIVLFNGNTLHAGMHPRTHDYRIVINFNFIII